MAAQLELSYNSEVTECKKIIPGEILKGMLTDTNPTASGGTHGVTTSNPSGGSITTHPVDKPIEEIEEKPTETKQTFTDVLDTHWAKEYIEKTSYKKSRVFLKKMKKILGEKMTAQTGFGKIPSHRIE